MTLLEQGRGTNYYRAFLRAIGSLGAWLQQLRAKDPLTGPIECLFCKTEIAERGTLHSFTTDSARRGVGYVCTSCGDSAKEQTLTRVPHQYTEVVHVILMNEAGTNPLSQDTIEDSTVNLVVDLTRAFSEAELIISTTPGPGATGPGVVSIVYDMGRGVFVVDRNTLKRISAFRDIGGNYMWDLSLQVDKPGKFLGRPIYETAR